MLLPVSEGTLQLVQRDATLWLPKEWAQEVAPFLPLPPPLPDLALLPSHVS